MIIGQINELMDLPRKLGCFRKNYFFEEWTNFRNNEFINEPKIIFYWLKRNYMWSCPTEFKLEFTFYILVSC